MEISFITSNSGKVQTLQSFLDIYACKNVVLKGRNLNIVEPQADSVAEVSMFKARQAYEILKTPVVVEDGGLDITALNGFPGVYTRYATDKLGPEGFMRLMDGIKDRSGRFTSTTTYINETGEAVQFHRKGGEVKIAEKMSNVDHPLAWSSLWKIIYIEHYKKTLAEMSVDEFNAYYRTRKDDSSLSMFARHIAGLPQL